MAQCVHQVKGKASIVSICRCPNTVEDVTRYVAIVSVGGALGIWNDGLGTSELCVSVRGSAGKDVEERDGASCQKLRRGISVLVLVVRGKYGRKLCS